MGTNTTGKIKRSVKLTQSEIASIKSRMAEYPTKVAAGLAMGINPDTMDRAVRIGTCSGESYRILFPAEEKDNDDA